MFNIYTFTVYVQGGDSEVYVKIMTKTLDAGAEDIIKEINRVEKMMENKNSDNVKEKLTKKRNVLNSFKVRTKDELQSFSELKYLLKKLLI